MGQSASVGFNGNGNNDKVKAKYIPMSREEVKNFKQIASFQKSVPDPQQGPENFKGKDPVKSPGIPSKDLAVEGNALKQSMHSSGNPLPVENFKGHEEFMSDSSKPPVQDAASWKNEKGISSSSSASPGNHMRPEGNFQLPRTKEHSMNGNSLDGENEHNSKYITLIGPPLKTMRPGFLKEKLAGLDNQGQKFPQQHPDKGLGYKNGEETKPNGKNTPAQFNNNPKMENHQEDFETGHKQLPATFKENFENTFTPSNHMPAAGDESSSNNTPTTLTSHKTVYPKGQELKESPVTALQEKPVVTSPTGKAMKQVDGFAQVKLSDKERQEHGQKPAEISPMSNKFQGPISHHAGQIDNSEHFSMTGGALSNAKEKPTDGTSLQQVQSNPLKEHDSGAKLQQSFPLQGHVPNSLNPSVEGNKLHHATEGHMNGKSESDLGQPSEEGEPVPMIDLNKGGTLSGTDFGPANGEEFPSPGEDPGMQSQPNGNAGEDYAPGNGEGFASPGDDTGEQSQPMPDATQGSRPVYDNEAIQGISDLAHKEDQNILQQVNSMGQAGSDQNVVIGYDDASISQAYTGESSRGESQDKIQRTEDDMEKESSSSVGSNGYKSEARVTSDYYNTDPADDCLCPKKGWSLNYH